MKARDFCYWLQGQFELNPGVALSSEQVDIVQKHLSLVFIHEIDPSFPPEQKPALDKAHGNPSNVVMRC